MENIKADSNVGQKSYSDLFFDMSVYSSYSDLTGVKVYYDDKYIVGLELFYDYSSTGLFKGNSEIVNSKICEISLEKGEYLSRIEGNFDSDGIARLDFFTNDNKIIEIGTPSDKNFIFFNTESPIISLKAAFGTYLTYLEPVYKSSEFENESTSKLIGRKWPNSQNFTLNYNETFGKIKEIKLYTCDNYIKGYSLIYENKEILQCNVFPKSNNNIKCISLKLSQGEEIESIYIRSGDIIDNMSFYTNKGNTLAAGGIGGGPHLVQTPKGKQFCGFDSGVADNLHYVIIKYN